MNNLLIESQHLNTNTFEEYTFFQKVLFGLQATLIELPISLVAQLTTLKIMDSFGFEVTEQQNVKEVFDALDDPKGNWGFSLIKTIFVSYLCFFGPLLEEYIFRDHIQKNISLLQEKPDSVQSKISRIVFNGLLFGACHISPSHGMLNIPIFVTTSIGGIVYATLKEQTGDIVASTAAHSAHNSFVYATWAFGC